MAKIVVTGAAGNIAYSLLWRIAAGDVFGDERVHVEEHLPSAYELAVELAEEALAEVGVQSGSGVIITGSVVTAGEARAMFGKDPQ